MGDYFIIWAIIGLLFILLFFIPKYNRKRIVWLRSGIGLMIVLTISGLATYVYRNITSLFGYTFQQNQSLLGGYLCIALSLFLCIIWYILVTHWNKNYKK